MAEATPLTTETIFEIKRLASLMATAHVRRFANEHRDRLGLTNNETPWNTKRRVATTCEEFSVYLKNVRVSAEPAPPTEAWPAPTPLPTLCRIFGGQQFDTPFGVTCPAGHGGDEGVPA